MKKAKKPENAQKASVLPPPKTTAAAPDANQLPGECLAMIDGLKRLYLSGGYIVMIVSRESSGEVGAVLTESVATKMTAREFVDTLHAAQDWGLQAFTVNRQKLQNREGSPPDDGK